MQMQLYQKEESLLKIMELGHFSNFVSVIKRAIYSAKSVNYDLYHIVADIRSAIIYFLVPQYKTADKVIKSSKLIKQLLKVFMNFQMIFFYEGKVYVGLFEHLVNYRSINRGLMIEKVLCQPIESCINLTLWEGKIFFIEEKIFYFHWSSPENLRPLKNTSYGQIWWIFFGMVVLSEDDLPE